MENPHYQEWIEDYLLGNLSRDELEAFEKKKMTDPAFAKVVEESRLAFQAIQRARQNQLKSKLTRWDRQAIRYKRLAHTLMISVAIFMLAFMLICLGSYWFYQPDQIVNRFLNRTPEISNTLTQDARLYEPWELALQSLHDQHYHVALEYFYPFSFDPDSTMAYAAQWYLLLAEFGHAGESQHWRSALDAFIRSAPEPYQTLASDLSRMLSSPVYRFFFIKFLHQYLPAVQPRIM